MSFIAPDPANRTLTLLFLSRRGSARAVMAAALVGRVCGPRFRGLAAAVQPVATRDPETLGLLGRFGFPVEAAPEPRHFADLLAGPDGQLLDFVFTLSDTAAQEAPPEWPGHPVTAHWGCVDPVRAAAMAGRESERGIAYLEAYATLQRRLELFAALPFEALTRMTLQARLAAIGAGD